MANLISVNGVTDGVHSYLKACADRIPKAVRNGVFKESFRVNKVARGGVKDAAPGGQAFARQAPFTRLRAKGLKRPGNRSPLLRFRSAMRYKVKSAAAKTSSEIGFITGRLDRWAEKHAAGYRIRMTPAKSGWMAQVMRAAGVPRGRAFGAETGKSLKVPVREIIGPVYEAEKDNIYNNIRQRVIGAAKVGGRY